MASERAGSQGPSFHFPLAISHHPSYSDSGHLEDILAGPAPPDQRCELSFAERSSHLKHHPDAYHPEPGLSLARQLGSLIKHQS